MMNGKQNAVDAVRNGGKDPLLYGLQLIERLLAIGKWIFGSMIVAVAGAGFGIGVFFATVNTRLTNIESTQKAQSTILKAIEAAVGRGILPRAEVRIDRLEQTFHEHERQDVKRFEEHHGHQE
jgi:hypothetical protein